MSHIFIIYRQNYRSTFWLSMLSMCVVHLYMGGIPKTVLYNVLPQITSNVRKLTSLQIV